MKNVTISSAEVSVGFLSMNYAPETTGIGPYSDRLTRLLGVHGFSINVVTAYPHYPAKSMFNDVASLDNKRVGNVLRVRHVAYTGPNLVLRLLSEVSFGLAAWWSTRRVRFDLILAVSPPLVSGLVFRLLRSTISRKREALIVWAQDLYGPAADEVATASARKVGLIRFLEKRYYSQASYVVSIHDGFRDALVREYSIDPSKIITQRNWSRWESIDYDACDLRAVELRDKYGWSDKKVILHAGNIGAKQSLETMVEAARKIALEDGPSNFLFVALGDGNRRAVIEEMSKDLPNFQLMAHVSDEDFFPVLRAADILLVSEVSSMTSASLPSKLLSYFNAGRPVIVASNEASLTWLEAKKSGVCVHVKPQDSEALVRRAVQVWDDVSYRIRCNRQGPEYAAATFAENVAVDAFSSVLMSAYDRSDV